MKYSPLFSAFLIISAVVVSACGSLSTNSTETQAPSATSPLVTSPEASPEAAPEIAAAEGSSESASPAPADAPASSNATSYQEPNDLFQISVGGSVDFGSAQGQQVNTAALEEALKEEYENRLEDVAWQGSEIQPDGSVRVDWVGRDTDGNDLDAISFVEQRGDTIFILNLYGINKAYADYNSDAETIVGNAARDSNSRNLVF
jgi:hypothetical protein